MAQTATQYRSLIRYWLHGLPLLFVFTAFLLVVAIADIAGLIIGNPTTSVPRGIYYATAPMRAGYVTFCLETRHKAAPYYANFCSPDAPDGLQILKRIAVRRPDGSLIVQGDSTRALDSRYLGPVTREQIRGWWQPLIQIGAVRAEAKSAVTSNPAAGHAPKPSSLTSCALRRVTTNSLMSCLKK